MVSSPIDDAGFPCKYLKPQIVFAVLSLTAGLCMVFVNAPFEAPDEASHFWRAYHVSEGNFLSCRPHDVAGGTIPKSIACAHLPFENLVAHPENRVDRQALSNGLHEPFNNKDRVFIPMGFAALYTPIVYAPQVAGIAVGRLFGLSALHMMYLGRIANLLCWIAVIYTAIRITPVFKWVFVVVALLPMNVFLAASLSADTPQVCIAVLLFALVLQALWQNETLNWMQMLTIAVLSVILAFAKQTYFPLTGLVFLIPAKRFNGMSKKVLFCCSAIGLSLLMAMIWSFVIKGIYTPIHGANAPEQLSLLMADPWSFPEILAHSCAKYYKSDIITFIGVLGFLDTRLPNWIYYTYPLVLTGLALFESGPVALLKWFQRCWIGLLCFGVFILIEVSMFLTWTPPGSQIIEGVQGRYFLPIAVPVLLALFYNQRFKVSKQGLFALSITVYSFTVLTVTCWTVYNRYFGPVV